MTAMMSASGMTPGMTMPTTGMPMPATGINFAMVPRCRMVMEKCPGGMKITCSCDDKMAAGMLQNLCTMLAGTMCSCCCMMNGMMVNCCNLTMGMYKTEMTKDGCCITCTSGDAKCCEMIQACCDCMSQMMKAGCTCCVMMNGTPVCCC